MHTPIHVTVPEPCHENWHAMTPNEQGRYCLSCQKTVIDFSMMSNQEILNYISTASSHVCGNFTTDQLNKTYSENKGKRSFSWRYAWTMIVATFLMTGGGAAMAQGEVKVRGEVALDRKPPPPVIKKQPGTAAVIIPDIIIKGAVIDDNTGKPVSFASVRFRHAGSGTAANNDGQFTLTDRENNMSLLVVSAVGYGTKEYELMPGDYTPQIRLTPEVRSLDTVVVTYNTSSSVRGMVVCTTTITTAQEITRRFNEWSLKKAVVVYPNPVIRGNGVAVSLNLEKSGDYKLELMDAGGRIIWVQGLQNIQKTQTISVPTQSSWSKGVYWLRITGATKKIYTAKVLLQ